MNPFGEGQGGIPYPPIDIPTPSIPSADFKTIGKQFAEGQQESMDNLVQGLNLQCGSGAGTKAQTWAQMFQGIWNGDFLFCWLQKLVKFFMGAFFNVLAWLMGQVFQIFDSGGASMNTLFATTVQGMFGVEADTLTKGSMGSHDARAKTAAGIASTITNALHAGVPTGGAGKLAPSSAGADKFLEMASHMAIEGWLMSWIVDAASAHELERFGDLKDTLEATLGVGRLSRRALAPPMKILVEDPYTALLNQTFLPAPLQPAELVRQYIRNQITRDQLQAAMSLHGYDSDKVTALIYDQSKTLSMPEIVELISHGMFSTDDAINALRHQGYDAETAPLALQVATRNRTDQWERKGAEEALTLYKGGKISRAGYDDVINRTRLPDDEKQAWHGYADIFDYAKQSPGTTEPKRASLGEGLQMLERGIWTLPDYEKLLNYYNYIPADEFDLAQLANTEAQEYTTLQANKAAAAQKRAQREADRLKRAQMMVEDIGVSTGMFETLVEEGLRTLAQYRQYLLNKSVAADNADALVQALVIKLAQKAAAAAAKLAAQNKAKVKQVDLAQLETAVKQGLMTIQDFTTRVKALGMSDADAHLIEQELSNSIGAADTKAKAAAAAKATAAQKHVDLSQEERAVRLGIVSMNDYQQFLISHGFTAEEQGILMMTLQDQLTQDQKTAATKQAAAAKLAQKGIPLAQLERLVRAGVKTTADYTAALASAGYDAADQQAMTQYLQLQMQQDQQDLVVHGHAAALVDQMGVSLADLERAVKLSVVPIATYTDALQRAGLSAQDQQTLTANLAAAIKATRAQQATTASVSKQVAAAGVSLATLEKDTVSGKLSVDQLQGLLNGYGVAAGDVADVVALVQDEIANKAAVDALVAQAGARAAAKGLDLAQDTAAYKAGVMTEDDWRARVASLGYDAADVEILFETLAAAQAAAAAKSATKSTTAAPAAAAAASSTAAGG